MIIDAHVNVDPTKFPMQRALDVLAESRIEQAIVFADPRSSDLEASNAYVLREAAHSPVFPFYYIGGNPYTDTRPDELRLPDNLQDYAGIRWHRWAAEGIDRQGLLDQDELDWAIHLMESADFEALTAAATHYSLPIIFEESFAVTIEFALRYPSLDIIVPHLGSRSGGETNMLRALWDQANVYFDTSLSQLDETALSRLGTDRILFGSAFPEGDPEQELDKIDRLPVSEEVKEAIYGDNVESLLRSYVRR